MTTVLITGGAGVLGSQLVMKTSAAGYMTRGMSRRERPPALPTDVQWTRADLESGDGLAEALAGVDVIIHAASSARERTWQIDVEGTQRLVKEASACGVSHIIYISIVGIDRIPTPYYRSKVAAEEVITSGTLPWTILRATQFHDLLNQFIRGYLHRGFILAPVTYQYQPVDVGEVASVLCACVAQGPRQRVPDMGGPEVRALGQLISAWLATHHLHRLIIPKHVSGEQARAFENGYNTCPDNRQGRVTWAAWLAGTVAPR
jgi:uncharacterized protein YbjT (DUF2867 family)